MTISALPPVPQRTDLPADFVVKADNFVAALPVLAEQINETSASMSAVAAGGAYAIAYTFDPATTNTDPGAGKLRLSSSTQKLATTIHLSSTSGGIDIAPIIDSMDDSTSVVKGHLRITKLGDTSVWILFSLTDVTVSTGYRNLTVSVVDSSSDSPFASGDALILQFTRVGDVGPTGSLVRRTTSIASSSSPGINIDNFDTLVITALAVPATLAAPSGTPQDGRTLMYRIKDNGTARTLAYNAIFRNSPDLALPASTILGKTLYLGFAYNSADVKWDLIAVLNNF